jgi:Uma2 family endonuclease
VLEARLRSGPCTVFGVDVQVLLGLKKSGQKQYVYPDATVSCNPADSRLDNTLIEAPRAVIEVLSPSTEAKDRGVKFRAYQQCPTIQEIVLVDQFAQYVQVWQRDEQDPTFWRYRHYGPGETVEFASIDIHFGIEELYQGLTFATGEEDEDE